MTKLEKAKEVIKEYYDNARCGIFDTRNVGGDSMTTIYKEDGLTIDIGYFWEYFEVFGLTDDDFEELEFFYNRLRNEVIDWSRDDD